MAGFKAHKCRDVDPSLGQGSSECTTAARASSDLGWILTLNPGGLALPTSPEWLKFVQEFQENFGS